MAKKLSFKWKDFEESVSLTFGRLREEKDFSDVTLACEDGKLVEAHKIVLAASSSFFEKILKSNEHPHPIIYLAKVKEDILSIIMDFLYYYGETNVSQENLDIFLAVAEELKIKGLVDGIYQGPTKTNLKQYHKQEDVYHDGKEPRKDAK